MEQNHLVQLQRQFEQYLTENLFQGKPAELYESINYLMGLGGKRLRPVALLVAINAAGKDAVIGLNAAWCFEVFHTFTLAHDDIMDNAPKRRGKPALHTQYNIPTAILAGDHMLLYVYKKLMDYPPEIAHQLMELITHTGIEICEGQFMDMQFETLPQVSEKNYLEMIKLKTAVLLGACLKAGGILANASPKDQELLYKLGLDLGIGFQIMDDILDAFSTNPKVGKLQGGDIIANKKTILWIKAMELSNPSQAEKLQYWISQTDFNPSQKVEEVLAIFNQLDIKAKVEKERDQCYNSAMEAMEQLSFNKNDKIPLQLFCNFLTARTH